MMALTTMTIIGYDDYSFDDYYSNYDDNDDNFYDDDNSYYGTDDSYCTVGANECTGAYVKATDACKCKLLN